MREPLPQTWAELADAVNGREVFGRAGLRDPDARCEHFDPVPNIDWLGFYRTSPGNGSCVGDGHYLCKGCSEFDASKFDETPNTDHGGEA